MVDHEAVYRVLFNGVLDAIEELEHQNYGYAKLSLIKMLQVAEDICLDAGEETPVVGLLTSLDTGASIRHHQLE